MCRYAQFVSWPASTWHRLPSRLVRLVAFASSRIIPNYIYRKTESLSLFLATSMQFSGIFGESKLCCGPAGLKFTARPQSFLAAISNNCLHLIASSKLRKGRRTERALAIQLYLFGAQMKWNSIYERQRVVCAISAKFSGSGHQWGIKDIT